uniref:Ig-like domain-containing protein n=1 Tax=Salarias fasciatus TaxID=181472 RepID=A0A672GSP5_SALFA
MQENKVEQTPSLSQLLRESYLAEARAQQRHSEMSRSDASSSRLQIYGSLKGKAEDPTGLNDAQFPDLSAFLSQEELDKSVNLARQAIGHDPREERPEVKASVAPLTSSGISSASPARNTPYGPETQSKKEFLNKAADFIEELSSLFKANSSKRVRPRACKTHRSRVPNKTPGDGEAYALGPDSRERSLMCPEAEKERPSPAASHQPAVLPDPGQGQAEFHGGRVTEEQQHEPVSWEAEREAPAETPHSAEPVCEPPQFIQKLKSREVPEGSKVQLDCIVTGLPVPEVRWFCEGKELENSPDIQIITDGELHSLIIAEAFEEDTGRYSCFASNFYGTDSTSAEIYVEGASSSDSEGEQHFEHVSFYIFLQHIAVSPLNLQSQSSNHSYPQGLNGQPIMAAPVFTKSLQDLGALESQLVVLECRVKGVPSPRVDWYREGKLIEDSPDFRILQKKPRSPAETEEICTLVIAEVFPEDSGMFTCTANNKYGTVSSTATLRVKGNAVSHPPGSNGVLPEAQSSRQILPYPKPFVPSAEQEVPRPSTGTATNHKDSRSGSRVGLRVHFKLPEDEEEEQNDASGQSDEDVALASINKEPPPVLAKPKL